MTILINGPFPLEYGVHILSKVVRHAHYQHIIQYVVLCLTWKIQKQEQRRNVLQMLKLIKIQEQPALNT